MQNNIPLPAWLHHQLNVQDSSCLPAWVQAFKSKFNHRLAQEGLPAAKTEAWKYTDLSFLQKELKATVNPGTDDLAFAYHLKEDIKIALVDGFYKSFYSGTLPAGVIISSLKQAFNMHPDLLKTYLLQGAMPDHFTTQLNSALFDDGLFIYLPADCNLLLPVHLLATATASATLIQSHCIIVLEERSKLTLIENYIGTSQNYLTNIVHKFFLQQNAALNYYKIQDEDPTAIHFDSIYVEQQANSKLSHVNAALGGKLSRDDVTINLHGQGAHCDAAGFYKLTRDAQYIDHHITINHYAPHTQSEMLYKGILEKKSTAVFNGRLHVAKDAAKIAAHQANHHILLSNKAEAYSKPELEIYADDVKCKHGATTGQLDEQALFYLRARGIPRHEAIHMLIESFAAEVLERILHPELNKHLYKRVLL